MAKLGVPVEGARRASLRGTYYTRTWRGLIIAQSQDRPSRRRMSRRRREAIEQLEGSIWAIRYMDGTLVAQAIDATRHSLILWRDLLTATMAGTLLAMRTTDGRLIVPERYRRLVERALDTLDLVTTGMLVRGPDRWHIMGTGQAGQVLTSRGPGAVPEWR